MKTCSICKNTTFEVFSHHHASLCESCYRTVALKPIAALRANAQAELSRLNSLYDELASALGKAQQVDSKGITKFVCDCGERCPTGLALAEHTATCMERPVARMSRVFGSPSVPRPQTYQERLAARNHTKVI